MEKILRGKYLLRKGTSPTGEQFVTLTGVFKPMNFSLDEIKDNDEMWVSDLVVGPGGIRFHEPINGREQCSPEDFLEGQGQLPRDWKKREPL